MFNLLVSGNDEAWNGEPYSYERSRLFEYTEDAITGRFNELREDQIARLIRLPTVFAYEKQNEKDARVGEVTKFSIRNREVVVSYRFDDRVRPIPHQLLMERSRTLDIANWELNRTHWAVKDVDLFEFLEAQGLIAPSQDGDGDIEIADLPEPQRISIIPTAFRIPDDPPDPLLLSLMMPFNPELNSVRDTVRSACEEVGLACRRADEIWDHDEIIQDVFSLIYRSRIVVCDFTTQNPNVYYEAGIAHTLGRPVIPITQDIDLLPFDLKHRRALRYSPTPDGMAQLRGDILARIKRVMEQV